MFVDGPETEGMEVEPLGGMDDCTQPISWESQVARMELGELMGVPAGSPEGDSLGEESVAEQPLMETNDKASSTADAMLEED